MTYSSELEALRDRRPDGTLYCLHRDRLERVARAFRGGFPGEVMYAVKCNPEPRLLQTLVGCGFTMFDVASMSEIELARAIAPKAELFFMHPVKTVEEIAAACERFDVRYFAVDHLDELAKVEEAVTGDRVSTVVMVRLATPGEATYDLSAKFGATPGETIEIMRRAAHEGFSVGLCFHVGSQMTDARMWAEAIRMAGGIIEEAGVAIDALDVGGGFPAAYGGIATPDPGMIFSVIDEEIRRLRLPPSVRILCEPGRAIAAPAFTTLARVLLRKDRRLYINEGVWGSLSESMTGRIHFPASAMALDGEPPSGAPVEFEIQGVTCDPTDRLYTRYTLPDDIRRDHWLRFDLTGAYSIALKTAFNGFGYGEIVIVDERTARADETRMLASAED
ncbi:MAG: type III PLP-dependent enzyme [Geminicoccaceae bacterium]